MSRIYGIIYKIRNKINNKIYFGQTVEKKGFKARYKNNLGNNTHNKHLKNSIKKYGIDAFDIDESFDIAHSKNELNKLEDMYIKIYDTTNDKYGYNMKYGGTNGKLTKKHREFLSKRNLEEKKWAGEDNPKARKVICITDRKVFNTGIDAGLYYNINSSNISACCLGNIKTLKCKNENGVEINSIWMHLSEYEQLSKDEIDELIEDRLHNPHLKPVICLNTKEEFDTVKEASIKYNIIDTNIIRCCKGKARYSGAMIDKDENNINLIWMYLNDYNKLSDSEITRILYENFKNSTYGQVVCITTNKTFNTTKEACKYYNIKSDHIRDCCINKIKYCGKLTNGEVLMWKYKRDIK